jgi:MFS family permease
MLVFALMSFSSGTLYDKLGARTVVSAGAALLGLGIFMLSFLEAGWDYVALVPGMVVLGLGIGLFYSSITTAAVTSLDASRSSLAGGIVYMCQVAGVPSGWASTLRSSSRNPSFPRGSGSPSVSTRRWPRLASSWRWRTSVAPRR